MTLHAFKENLKGTKFEGHTLEDILNCLSILCDFQSEKENEMNCNTISKVSKDSANLIYERLNNMGYYDMAQ